MEACRLVVGVALRGSFKAPSTVNAGLDIITRPTLHNSYEKAINLHGKRLNDNLISLQSLRNSSLAARLNSALQQYLL